MKTQANENNAICVFVNFHFMLKPFVPTYLYLDRLLTSFNKNSIFYVNKNQHNFY